MIKTYSIDRHHGGMSKFYTDRCKKYKKKTVHQKHRSGIYRDFFRMVMEDVVVNAMKVKLPIGVMVMKTYKTQKFSDKHINHELTDDYNDPVYYLNLHTDGLKPMIRVYKNKRWGFSFKSWKIVLRDSCKKLVSTEFLKDYKRYIR